MVISSLNAQMYDQIAKLNERGISACMIQRHRMVSWFTAKETLSFLYVCMVNTIYLLSFVETP